MRRTTYRREILELPVNESNSPKRNKLLHNQRHNTVQSYNKSECENDNSNDINDKVNNFLKEISDLPSADKESKKVLGSEEPISSADMGCPWQECYDETTGFPYYWNVNTNEVTWEMPADYKSSLGMNQSTRQSSQKIVTLNSTSNRIMSKYDATTSAPRTVLYKSQLSTQLSQDTKKRSQLTAKYSSRKSSESEDEKIELITSYGEESESDDENPSNQKHLLSKKNKLSLPIPKPTVEIPKVPIGPTRIYRIQPEPQVIKPPLQSDTEILDYNLKAPNHNDVRTLVNKLNRETVEKNKLIESSDDSTILNHLRNQAKVLQDLGGEIPQDVEKLIKPTTDEYRQSSPLQQPVDDIIAQIEREQPPDLRNKDNQLTAATSKGANSLISLVAGYGDDSDNEDEDEIEHNNQPVKSLFPVLDSTQTSDNVYKPSINYSEENNEETGENSLDKQTDLQTNLISTDNNDEFDTKLFKRKRRIALDVLPIKKPKPDLISYVQTSADTPGVNESRAGFGFQKNHEVATVPTVDNLSVTNPTASSSLYDKFKSSGISFVKAETINLQKNTEQINNIPDIDEPKREVIEGLKDMAELVKEKIQFLEEGKEPVSAVQIMSIKLDTLFEAYQAKGVSDHYFYTWLKETTTDLNKLEQAAVPAGWFCQWDSYEEKVAKLKKLQKPTEKYFQRYQPEFLDKFQPNYG